MPRSRLLLLALAVTFVPVLQAQQAATAKKLYCWNEHGRKVCGDALPASAVDSARTEINARSGMASARVDRALTADERATAAMQAQIQAQAREAAEAEHRRLMAMVTTFNTEDDLRHAFDSRIELSRGSIKTAEMGIAGLRDSLVALLRRAGESELNGKPVGKKLAADIQVQHAELLKQQSMLAQIRLDADNIRNQLNEALTRYRELKPAGVLVPTPAG